MTAKKVSATASTPKVTAPSTVTPTTKRASKPVAKKAPTAKATMATEARKIFAKHYGNKPRKDIIQMLLTKVGMASNYVNTFYGTEKKKADLRAASAGTPS